MELGTWIYERGSELGTCVGQLGRLLFVYYFAGRVRVLCEKQYTGWTRRPPALLVSAMRCGSAGSVPDPPYSRPARFDEAAGAVRVACSSSRLGMQTRTAAIRIRRPKVQLPVGWCPMVPDPADRRVPDVLIFKTDWSSGNARFFPFPICPRFHPVPDHPKAQAMD